MPTLLIIDDEPSIRHAFRKVMAAADTIIVEASDSAEGIRQFRECAPDVAVVDVNLPDASGLDLFKEFASIDADVPVIYITGAATTQSAIRATQMGAFDYLFKPLSLETLEDTITAALELRRLREPVDISRSINPFEHEADSAEQMIGQSASMMDVYRSIGKVAAKTVPVLITGETGTGKELVARALVQNSGRADKPFHALNCAALPEQLVESELFGHEVGAFTGADRVRVGRFEQASGGTLFLDEIGELSLASQAKILRLLETQQFERLGGSETVSTDVRLITATNRDLNEMVSQGTFRADLLYRIDVFSIHLPPLRERGTDMDLLIQHFLRRASTSLDLPRRVLDQEAMNLLHRHPWPGNIRELRGAIERAMITAKGTTIHSTDLPQSLGDHQARIDPETAEIDLNEWRHWLSRQLTADSSNVYAKWTTMTEGFLLRRIVATTNGNLSKASRILGIHRRTLRMKLAEQQRIDTAVQPTERDEDIGHS